MIERKEFIVNVSDATIICYQIVHVSFTGKASQLPVGNSMHDIDLRHVCQMRETNRITAITNTGIYKNANMQNVLMHITFFPFLIAGFCKDLYHVT